MTRPPRPQALARSPLVRPISPISPISPVRPVRPIGPVRPISLSCALTLTVAMTAPLACGESATTTDAPAPVDPAAEAAALARPADHADSRTQQARARVDALLADPSPTTLLAALAQTHTTARDLLGPHRLHYIADFSLTPEAPSRPIVDQPNQLEQAVTDELTLVLGSAVGDPLRLHLSQKTAKDEGREIIILDQQVYTRLAHRGWQTRALDSELHNVWLDEAQHCVHDLVELAAPALAVAVHEPDTGDSGDTLMVTLTRAATSDPALIVAGTGREWRQRSELGEITGSIRLDRATGLWRSAELEVAYVVRDVLDRPQRGRATLRATVTPSAPADLVIEAPAHPTPAPARTRPEQERQRLLHGLAGT